jgi:hypothetical protein
MWSTSLPDCPSGTRSTGSDNWGGGWIPNGISIVRVGDSRDQVASALYDSNPRHIFGRGPGPEPRTDAATGGKMNVTVFGLGARQAEATRVQNERPMPADTLSGIGDAGPTAILTTLIRFGA